MNTLLGSPENPVFGGLLRHWRTARRMTQLGLATEAGISARHLSFLETGRAQPSREMVQLLAGMLDVPLADRNALLVGAGYAPVYGQRPLEAPELDHIRRALEFTLRQQEPYPALVHERPITTSSCATRRRAASSKCFAGPSRQTRPSTASARSSIRTACVPTWPTGRRLPSA